MTYIHFLLRAILGLLLAVIVATWVRSYSYADGVEFDAIGLHVIAMTTTGGGRIVWCGQPTPSASYKAQRKVYASTAPRIPGKPGWRPGAADTWKTAIFDQGSISLLGAPFHYVEFAFWPPAILAGVFPLFFLVRRTCNAIRRRRPGLCRQCGYDLRATPDRCPECGAPGGPGRIGPVQIVRLCIGSLIVGGALVAMLFGIDWLRHHDFRNSALSPIDFEALFRIESNDQVGSSTIVPESIRQLEGKRVAIDGVVLRSTPPDDRNFAILWGFVDNGPAPIILARFIHDRSLSPDDMLRRVHIVGTFRMMTGEDHGRSTAACWIEVGSITPFLEVP